MNNHNLAPTEVSKYKIALMKAKKMTAIIIPIVIVLAIIVLSLQYRKFFKELTVFNDIHINDQQDEVLYRLGAPTYVLDSEETGNGFLAHFQRIYYVNNPSDTINQMPHNKKIEDYYTWTYENVNGSRFSVYFDNAGIVEMVEFYSDSINRKAWGPIAGICNGDSEKKVLRLGSPSAVSIENTVKTIEYSDIGLVFLLSKGQVYMVNIKKPKNENKFVFLYFIRMLL